MNDKTKIKFLKSAVALTVIYQFLMTSIIREMSAEYKKARTTANLNYKVVQSFIKHCEADPAILAAVHSDVEFDWVVKDLEL